MHSLLDPTYLIHSFGYIGFFLLILIESGVILGFFLPGDSLLFTAGLLASQGIVSIWIIIPLAILGAIIGNSIGYYTGAKLGPRIFKREKSLFLSPKRVEQANVFFDAQGPKSLILARFIPAVRTFIPIVAGIGNMKYKTFITFNAIGGILWGFMMPVLGYALGSSIPDIDKYLLPIVILVSIVSGLPVLFHYLKARKKSKVAEESSQL